MRNLKTFMTIVIMFLLMITAGLSQVGADKKAPDFTLPDMNGKNFQLSQNTEGKLTLLNFWATWCMPCREEMKKLKKIQKKYEDKGLEIVCVSVDDPKTVSKVKSFIKTNRYKYTVLLDTNNEVMRLYQVTNPPYTFLIDEHGELVYTHSGYRKGDEKILEKHIAEILEK